MTSIAGVLACPIAAKQAATSTVPPKRCPKRLPIRSLCQPDASMPSTFMAIRRS